MLRLAISIPIWTAALLAPAADCADFEAAGLAGYGFSDGEDQRRERTRSCGASLRLFPAGKHAAGFDYLFADFRGGVFNRHFITISYVLHPIRGRARPFFQFGPGIVVTRWNYQFRGQPISGAETEFAAVAGFGLTIDASPRIFVRPQVRTYWYTADFPRRGTTVTFLPGVELGWRF